MKVNELKLLIRNGGLSSEELDRACGETVHELVREKYKQDQVEAIDNNYLAHPENEKYKAEFFALQAYRERCKALVKSVRGDL